MSQKLPALYNSFSNCLLGPKMRVSLISGFCFDGRAKSAYSQRQNSRQLPMLSLKSGSSASPGLGYLLSISRTREDTAVEEPNRGTAFELILCTFPTTFRSKVCGAEYRETNDPETEVWRGCRRSSTAMDEYTTASCWRMTSEPKPSAGRSTTNASFSISGTPLMTPLALPMEIASDSLFRA